MSDQVAPPPDALLLKVEEALFEVRRVIAPQIDLNRAPVAA
jgi:hypothetical protein